MKKFSNPPNFITISPRVVSSFISLFHVLFWRFNSSFSLFLSLLRTKQVVCIIFLSRPAFNVFLFYSVRPPFFFLSSIGFFPCTFSFSFFLPFCWFYSVFFLFLFFLYFTLSFFSCFFVSFLSAFLLFFLFFFSIFFRAISQFAAYTFLF